MSTIRPGTRSTRSSSAPPESSRRTACSSQKMGASSSPQDASSFESRIPNRSSRIPHRHPSSRIPNPESRIPHPASRNRASAIAHPHPKSPSKSPFRDSRLCRAALYGPPTDPGCGSGMRTRDTDPGYGCAIADARLRMRDSGMRDPGLWMSDVDQGSGISDEGFGIRATSPLVRDRGSTRKGRCRIELRDRRRFPASA